MPRVSICIPAYNPDYFELCLRSALAQSFVDAEILVSDDCPTDAIKVICDKYVRFVQYSRNPNPGPESNVRRLVQIANGEYIKFLFDDDVLHPFCVQFLLEALDATRDRNTRLAFSPRHLIDDRNHTTGFINHFNASGDGLKMVSGRDFLRLTALNHVNLVGEYTTALFRKADAFDGDGQFRLYRMEGDLFRGLIDLSAWVELAQLGDFVIHPKPLSYFRRHENATSNPQINWKFIYAITYYEDVLNFAFEKGYLPASDLPASYRNLVNTYRYWQNSFPQLNARIAQIEDALT
ncbi:glycosyltransferase (plasmid) [Rhizobium leguminosarum]|jgi:glycosyltransferase involved in cell wall biosynthesis|uniref:Glycosyl transferase 2 family protein n=1 Tax=Rhizobium leguminosarum TaxID=384 RepID=A0A2Z4YV70_RHILE|nr:MULTISPECIES: glycosyltransferase [Rhizobium]MDH6663785.1 glycosyltransferase involved in cell wall biosynthesis [Rhizobium sophorae]ASS59626.1 glucosyltransferase [Rhizobium leguminosarum bv. viciae]AVC45861.1 glycosyltransferase like 2 family protein [Rhizobium leguminosarum bv. viciae]AXA44468.1 Glycosyl transferase 2 family protein [Rhizobium leguminosarum]MBB4333288.1 glycosyltransferase involved in cell wall biosynthesis [Rhizobium leguminosarum]